MITGLSNYTNYNVRVIAVNGMGDSEPSTEHFGMPQEESLDITDTVVNGNQLTVTYERTLDSSSIPSQESFWVLVNGAPRNVTGVSISGRSVILTLEEPAKRAIRASDEVEVRYLTPPSGAPAIKDTAGNYANSCDFGEPPSEARNETDPGLLEPVSAEFTMVPATHSGPGTEVVFQIEFSEPVRVDIGRNYAYLLDVEGGTVTSAWWLDRDSTIWEIVLEPDDDKDIKIILPAGRACDDRGAPCASGGRSLATALEHTIAGDDGPRETRSVKPDDAGKEGKDNGNSDGNDPGSTGKESKSNDPSANTPSVGAPAIEGSPVVGQTLTATTSGIADDDGISKAVFTYQWLADDVEIDGATSSTYTVDTDDVGKTLKVRVAFSDDAGNAEAVVSDATGTVEAVPAEEESDNSGEQSSTTSLTAEFLSVPESHDGETTFTFRVSFSEELQNQSGTRLRVALSLTGAEVQKVRRVDKQRDLFEFTVEPTGTDTVTVSLDAFTGDCADDNAICTADGEALSGSIQTQIAGP